MLSQAVCLRAPSLGFYLCFSLSPKSWVSSGSLVLVLDSASSSPLLPQFATGQSPRTDSTASSSPSHHLLHLFSIPPLPPWPVSRKLGWLQQLPIPHPAFRLSHSSLCWHSSAFIVLTARVPQGSAPASHSFSGPFTCLRRPAHPLHQCQFPVVRGSAHRPSRSAPATGAWLWMWVVRVSMVSWGNRWHGQAREHWESWVEQTGVGEYRRGAWITRVRMREQQISHKEVKT